MNGIKFQIRITKTLNDLLKEIAEEKGLTKNALIINALWEYVKEN